MPKQFLTEHDIEDMFKSGTTSLELRDDLVMTDLAYEKAKKLGITLSSAGEKPPSAPERPYVARYLNTQPTSSLSPVADMRREDIIRRVRSAVLAKLGDKVDAAQLDGIMEKVLDYTPFKRV